MWSASFIGEDSLVEDKIAKSVSPSTAMEVTKISSFSDVCKEKLR